jgi:hypothetical protein
MSIFLSKIIICAAVGQAKQGHRGLLALLLCGGKTTTNITISFFSLSIPNSMKCYNQFFEPLSQRYLDFVLSAYKDKKQQHSQSILYSLV